jgi:DNA topoisomerase-1
VTVAADAVDLTLPDGTEVTLQPEATARLAGLLYVTDEMPGVRRRARGRGFAYYDPDGKLIRDAGELVRFRSIGVPPAWTDVWICPLPDGHVQATGRDARRRKQYRYHVAWRTVRDATKFHRMSAFGHALPKLREHIQADLSGRRLGRERVLAAVLSIVDDTLIRVGNEEYARENQTFGATTLQDEHATVTADRVVLEFRGKHGKLHRAEVADPRVARVVRGCQELPGQQLFSYLDDEGGTVPITSDAVNAYLREIAGDDFSVKDFRTWGGSTAFIRAMKGGERTVKEAVAMVAGELGNTAAIARSSYIHPGLLLAARDGELPRATLAPRKGLDRWESALMRFLEEGERVAWVSPPAGTATRAT